MVQEQYKNASQVRVLKDLQLMWSVDRDYTILINSDYLLTELNLKFQYTIS